MLQASAAQVFAEFIRDECRPSCPLATVQMPLDDPIQRCLFGFMAAIATRCWQGLGIGIHRTIVAHPGFVPKPSDALDVVSVFTPMVSAFGQRALLWDCTAAQPIDCLARSESHSQSASATGPVGALRLSGRK
jgi:hypothetical protein